MHPNISQSRTFETTDHEPQEACMHYCVRVQTAQEHTAWSSPVYVGKKTAKRGGIDFAALA